MEKKEDINANNQLLKDNVTHQKQPLFPREMESELTSFREKWQKELQSSPINSKLKVQKIGDSRKQQSLDENAKYLFLKGIEMEKAGKLYEAIQFYRKAIQIVPDIEFKLDYRPKPKVQNSKIEFANELETSSQTDKDSDSDIAEDEILPTIHKKVAKTGLLCTFKFGQAGTHMSALPMEIILYILRWIVTSDLDLRSLEMFGMVCRGFYVCSRDSELWRLCCLRVWALNCGSTPGNYGTWRNMFIERSRVQYNGCYISKTTYIRSGENNFQDQFSRPWHLVAYYRYLRFFPDGKVLMLTSPDEPVQCIGQMKSRNPKQPVMIGYYRMIDDKVTLVVQRQETDAKSVPGGFKRNKRRDVPDSPEQTFHMELQVMNYRKRRHVKLVWNYYSVFTKTKRGDESTCNFELIGNRFPPFLFSRVKSFTAESEQILM
ncbi:F-box only protein 9 [Cylas formicarius]|uniref:F-box only protein 9 n=1 Tax=Cylas formicarius TaxID=197179 RepID=UPI0029587F54|nr:F-box only protein 9 [Cylas formicarius]